MTQWRGLTHQQLYLCLDQEILRWHCIQVSLSVAPIPSSETSSWNLGMAGGRGCVRWAGLVRLSDRVLTSSFICVLITDFKMALDNGISFSSSNYII